MIGIMAARGRALLFKVVESAQAGGLRSRRWAPLGQKRSFADLPSKVRFRAEIGHQMSAFKSKIRFPPSMCNFLAQLEQTEKWCGLT